MAGGDADLVERARPVLMCMGDTLFHCGALGAGEAIKLVNNRLAATIIGDRSEALVTGTKAGLSLDLMREVMGTTMAGNAHLSVNMPKKSLLGDFTPGLHGGPGAEGRAPRPGAGRGLWASHSPVGT